MGFWLDHSYVAGGNLKGCSLGMPIGGSKMVEETAVWLHNLLRKKTTMPWQGPYIVTKRINDLVYRIQLGPKAKPKVVHQNRLWYYSGENFTSRPCASRAAGWS